MSRLNFGFDPGPWPAGFVRIGHAGAGAYAPPNSLRSLELALSMGVDLVEFDVRPCQDALVLLHNDDLADYGFRGRLASRTALADLRALKTASGEPIASLEDAVGLLRGRARMNVDLKDAGYEEAVVDALRTHRVLGDVLFSSLIPGSLRRMRQLAPDALLGLSYPENKGDAISRPYLRPLVDALISAMRLSLSYRIERMIAGAAANAVMLYHRVVSPAVVARVHGAGGRVFVWTVDDLPGLRRARACKVDGIATNRPDLFALLS